MNDWEVSNVISIDNLNAMEIGALVDYCEANQISVRIEDGKITGIEE